jgi:hypothetical protein
MSEVRYVTAGIMNGRRDNDTTHLAPRIGDLVLCDGELTEVTAINEHVAGTHGGSPIRNDWRAREYVTARGSRWVGYMD